MITRLVNRAYVIKKGYVFNNAFMKKVLTGKASYISMVLTDK